MDKGLTVLERAGILIGLAILSAFPIRAQMPWGYPSPAIGANTPADAQRNALTALQTQVRAFQNTARTSSAFINDGYSRVWQQFQGVRSTYGTFKSTLTPQQVNYGANELADLDAGLNIIQEAFGEYQQDVARGQSISTALGDMCRVLDQAMAVWLQQLNTNSSRLRVGWV